jgi:2-C-methyl-D-erythritol 4-phosphate cytidylyltransferase/2-C-methyl-D-erythritol 2,4-cyclodiphosphate synthase
MRTIALVVAAGRGSRLGAELPKQYLPLAGEALIRHALRPLLEHPEIDGVRAVIREEDRASYDQAALGLDLLDPVIGGETRQESVRRGLESLASTAPERVLIHDGARPILAPEVIMPALKALENAAGVVPALPVVDTLKREQQGIIVATVPRAGLYRAQTPQVFRFADILKAHRDAVGSDLTDDSAVAERAGLTVRLVSGAEANLKVTVLADLARAEAILHGRLLDIRVGNGFDVHAFGPVRPLLLCGTVVPHEFGLAGHSDADVGLHAATDAILGALGEGDIGQHFPPSDPRWRNTSSDRFLRHAADRVLVRRGAIAHLDITLICERPKIGPHREAMRVRVAAILSIAPERVSIKATTTDGLGFTGRKEGIAGHATATVRLP